MHAHGIWARCWLSLVLLLLLSLLAGTANAEDEPEANENLATMSLDEVSHKLENPLTKL